jgi:iron complex outermembrane recepter protein
MTGLHWGENAVKACPSIGKIALPLPGRGTRPVRCTALAVALSACFAAAGARADQAGVAEAAGNQLEEITVTARYRQENLQDIPIAITALTGDQLEVRGFTNIVDLDKVAPNVTLQQSGASGGKTAVAYIRGVGQNDFTLSFEPGVGMYMDDVYFGTTFGAMFDLGDIDRVEILRGPQGTLFGMNSEGGAVRLFTTQPKGDNSGYLEVGYGSYNRTMVKGAYDFSIIPDTLTVRISGGMNTVDGFVTRYDYVCQHPTQSGNLPRLTSASNCEIGHEGGDTAETLRANVRWTPNENLEVRFSADALKDTGQAEANKTLAIVPGGGLADYNKNVLLNPTSGFYTGVPIDSRFITNSPYSTYSTFKDLSTGISLDPADNIDSWGVSNTVEWKTPVGLRFKNVLAYRGYSGNFAFDAAGAPLSDVMYSNPDFIHHQFSEEANVGDTAFGGKLDWVAGVYYYDGYSKQGNGPVLLTADEIVAPNPSPFCTTGCYGLNFLTNDPVTMIDKSVFVHANYHFTDQFTMELGIRYTDESKTYTFSRPLLPINPVNPIFIPPINPNYPSLAGFQDNPSATSKTDRVDPKIALQYRFTPELMGYVQYATGFKGGGINPHPVYASQVVPFKAETLASFEMGVKSQWFGNRVRLNGAIFDSNYRDLQITVIGAAGADIIQNAGKVRIMGVEGEAEAEPIPKLVFNASFGYLYYHTIELGSAAGVPGGPTLDTAPPYIPTWKWNVGAQYGFTVPGLGVLTPRLDWTYQTKVFNDPSNSPLAEQPGYGLLDARLTWDTPFKGWQAAVEIQNALNKVYYVNMYDDLASFNVVDGQPGMPRTAFATLKRSF